MSLKEIKPAGVEHRRDFINNNKTMILFRPRDTHGLATHYILVEDWQKLGLDELRTIRQNYEPCNY